MQEIIVDYVHDEKLKLAPPDGEHVLLSSPSAFASVFAILKLSFGV